MSKVTEWGKWGYKKGWSRKFILISEFKGPSCKNLALLYPKLDGLVWILFWHLLLFMDMLWVICKPFLFFSFWMSCYLLRSRFLRLFRLALLSKDHITFLAKCFNPFPSLSEKYLKSLTTIQISSNIHLKKNNNTNLSCRKDIYPKLLHQKVQPREA